MLSMPWHYVQTLSWQDLETASPLATAILSLLTVAFVAVLCPFVPWCWVRWTIARLGVILHVADRYLVRYGSWWVGTRVSSRWLRHVLMLSIFIIVAAGGILAPWPWCIWVLTFGILNILIVFRHWSRDEDEIESEVTPEGKPNLSAEMIGACAFVLVYTTTAFAQVQAARQAFQIPSDAGPFTFVRYSLFEFLKELPLVSYYDLFSDDLQFYNFNSVTPALYTAKWAVLAFRCAVGLIILAAVKRLIDIARRVSQGLDLRPIKAVLENPKTEPGAVDEAVGTLVRFALRGRQGAAEQLEQILTEVQDRQPRFIAGVRFAAANALASYGNSRGDSGKLLIAIDGYRRIAREDWPRERAPLDWAMTQNNLGDALARLGERESDTARLEEAAAAFRDALKEHTRERAPLDWAMTQSNLGVALWKLGERERDSAPLEKGGIAFCRGLEGSTPQHGA